MKFAVGQKVIYSGNQTSENKECKIVAIGKTFGSTFYIVRLENGVDIDALETQLTNFK